jgi:hypothetical protein
MTWLRCVSSARLRCARSLWAVAGRPPGSDLFPSGMGGRGRAVAGAGGARVRGAAVGTARRRRVASRSRSLFLARRRRRVRQQGTSRGRPYFAQRRRHVRQQDAPSEWSCSRRLKIPSCAGASGEAANSALQHIGRRPLAVSRCGHGLVRWACVTGPPEAPRPPELALQEPRAGDPQSRLGISYAHICWWCGALISCCLPCAAQVVDPKPGFKRVVKNFQGKDYQTIGLATVLSMPCTSATLIT